MKKIIVLKLALALVLGGEGANAVFEGRLVDGASGEVRANATLRARPKFFNAAHGGTELGSLAEVEVKTDARGNFSFYSGEWANPDNLDDIWLGVVIDGEEIVPRKRIVSVPYAIGANKAEKLLSEGMARVQKLNLPPSANGMVDDLVVSNQVIWGENNIVLAHELTGFGSVYLPDLHLNSSRCFSGMSRYMWKAGSSDDTKGELLDEIIRGSLFYNSVTNNLRWHKTFEMGDYSYAEWTIPNPPSESYSSKEGMPSDGLLTVRFQYQALRSPPRLLSEYTLALRVCIYHRSRNYNDDDTIYFLGSKDTLTGETFNLANIDGVSITFPIPKDYVAFIGISPRSEIRSETQKNGVMGTVSFAGVLYPFHAVEK